MKNQSNKVLSNTLFLYAKLLFSAVLSLYSTRLLLNALGIADFGIYNLIAGVILMLAFLNGAMTITTQRYLSFHLGASEGDRLKKIFNTSVSIHFLISLLVVALLELLGFWLLNGFLNIPAAKISEASICYHLMVVSTFFTINAVPYDALINAKEDMRFDALIGMCETFLKFFAAYTVIFFSSHKLVYYSAAIVLITVLLRLSKTLWCKLKYTESTLVLQWIKEGYLFREMLSYASWNLFGSLCYVASSQGVAIVLNRFLGVKINGSYAIAQQMNAQLQSFSVIIGKALNPQIVKSEGAGDRERMVRLALFSSKSSSFLLLLVVIPFIAEMDGILQLWLREVPTQVGVFCTVLLINALVNQLSTGLKSAVQATGKIKLYQVVVGTTVMLIVPVAYLMLLNGYTVVHILLASTGIELISLLLRLVICQGVAGISFGRFFHAVIFKVFAVALLPILAVYMMHSYMDFSFWRMLFTLMLNGLLLLFAIYLFGLTSSERDKLTTAIKKIKIKKLSPSI